MKKFILRKETFVQRPLHEVFEFFSRPENLELITPPWLGFRILTPSPILMKERTVVDYTVMLMGMRVHWQSLISEYQPPHRFVDEQLKGPYAFWRHTHTFSEVEGVTLIADEVEYGMPFGLLGRVIRKVMVHRQLQAIFNYRAGVIEQLFGTDEFLGDQLSSSLNIDLQGVRFEDSGIQQ